MKFVLAIIKPFKLDEITSTITWFIIKLIASLGPSAKEEHIALDISECG